MGAIVEGARWLETPVVGALMFVIVSLFAPVTFESLTQPLLALNAPVYVWVLITTGFGSILLTEMKEVITGGVLFTLVAGYVTITMSDWASLSVILSAWGLFGRSSTSSRGN